MTHAILRKSFQNRSRDSIITIYYFIITFRKSQAFFFKIMKNFQVDDRDLEYDDGQSRSDVPHYIPFYSESP